MMGSEGTEGEGKKKKKAATHALHTVFPSSSFLHSGVAIVWQL
jgi:hypothetical protein